MTTFVVTGGAGFTGSNFVHLLLAERPDARVVDIDLLTYAGNPANLEGLPPDRHTLVRADIADPEAMADAVPEAADAVINFAAETHVDRSILDARPFVRTNVLGVQVLLDVCRAGGVRRFVQVSTDEVYGALSPEEPPWAEDRPLAPSSPYSASKAAADLLVLAAHHTYGQDAVVTRCSNNYGPRQFPEKLIPLAITQALEGGEVPVYGDGRQVRDWIHVEDHARAVLAAVEAGEAGRVYNIGARCERQNLDVVRAVLDCLGKPESLIRHVRDRPGHDRRYAMDPTRIETELGWGPTRSFDEGLAETVRWYRENEAWWRACKDGSYRDYYAAWYGDR